MGDPRHAEEERPKPQSRQDAAREVLVVATVELVGDELFAGLQRHFAGEQVEIHLMAPAVAATGFDHVMGGVDEGIDAARERLAESAGQFERHDLDLSEVYVGDADPVEAISDALLVRPGAISEVILVTRTGAEKRPLEKDLFARTKDRFDVEVTLLELSGEEVTEHAHAEPAERETSHQTATTSGNLPALIPRATAAMGVGAIGTLVLIMLAANCSEELTSEELAMSGCDVRALIAGAFFLINFWHILGLTFFQAIRYRGIGEQVFSYTSLYGTPAAVVVSLLVA